MKKQIFFLFLCCSLVLVLSGCGEVITPEKVDTPQEAVQPSQEEPEKVTVPETFRVGDTVKMDKLSFTLNSVRWEKGDQFISPGEGEKWIVFDGTVENLGTEAQTISSMLMFKLYDAEHFAKDVSWFTPNLEGSLNGEIGAGRKMRGEIAFVVKEDETAWEFIFQPGVFRFGQAIYVVTIDEVK